MNPNFRGLADAVFIIASIIYRVDEPSAEFIGGEEEGFR